MHTRTRRCRMRAVGATQRTVLPTLLIFMMLCEHFTVDVDCSGAAEARPMSRQSPDNLNFSCCPKIPVATLPGIAENASWDTTNLYELSRTTGCNSAGLDSKNGCSAQANDVDEKRLYCSADLMYVRVPSGLLRGCCSAIQALEFNGNPLQQKGGTPGPYVSCQEGNSCDFAASCDNQCNLLSADRYDTDGVVGGKRIISEWNSITQLQQSKSWLTIKGNGFTESKQCLKQSSSQIMSALRGVVQSDSQDMLLSIDQAAFACARVVVSSFPREMCPGAPLNACSGHGSCQCNGAMDSSITPDKFALKCSCEHEYFGDECNVFCPESHGTWKPSGHGSGVCSCNEHWYGDSCQVHCVHGVYVKSASAQDTQTCKCNPGYEGAACDVQLPCWDNDARSACFGHGKCVNSTCDCVGGWTGEFCEDEPKKPAGPSNTRGYALKILIASVAGAFLLGAISFTIMKPLIQRCGSQKKKNGPNFSKALNEPFLKLGALPVSLPSEKRGEDSDPWDDNFLMDFSRLKIGQKIGSGTSGEVFVAGYDGAASVAAKKLFSPVGNAAAFDAAFRREVALLSQLNHPNVVQLLGVCYDEHNSCHIVTELCVGSLRDLIDNQAETPMPQELAINVALQIASGMLYLHERNVIHRDLKPANCLLAGSIPTVEDGAMSSQNSNFSVKICDFGLSRVKKSDMTMTEMTAEVGTPAYMAPELVSEEYVIDTVEAGKAVDVYSFGLTTLEIFTCVRPYSDLKLNNAFHLMIRVTGGLRPTMPIRRTSEDCIVPTAVENIVRDCWRKDPKSRPGFSDIVERLNQFIESRDGRTANERARSTSLEDDVGVSERKG